LDHDTQFTIGRLKDFQAINIFKRQLAITIDAVPIAGSITTFRVQALATELDLRRDIRFALIDVVGAVKDSGKIAVRGGQNFGNIIDVEVTKVAAWNRKAKRKSDAQSLCTKRRYEYSF